MGLLYLMVSMVKAARFEVDRWLCTISCLYVLRCVSFVYWRDDVVI